MSDLDALIERARGAHVRREVAEGYVRELDRWAVGEAPPRRWLARLGWVGAGLATAALVAVVVIGVGRGPTPGSPPLQIGDRVALIAAPATAYRIVEASPSTTTIAIDRGTVTARLFAGPASHHLVLQGGGVTATAHGTIYSLAVESGGATVRVEEGVVEVRRGDAVELVTAGTSWPAGTAAASDRAPAETLRALPPPPAAAAPIVADSGIDAGVTVEVDAAPAEPRAVAPGRGDAAPERASDVADATGDARTVKDRWRDARLLRGRGKFAEAIAECLAIADAGDPTWSPIALVEAQRIYSGPLADPEHAIAIGERMIREWPQDQLVGEARELRCRALEQLGRACTPP